MKKKLQAKKHTTTAQRRKMVLQVGQYFEEQGFDVAYLEAMNEFDLWADNGLTVWKVVVRPDLTVEKANERAEDVATYHQSKFTTVNHPIAIFVARDIVKGMPVGATRLVVPDETTVGKDVKGE